MGEHQPCAGVADEGQADDVEQVSDPDVPPGVVPFNDFLADEAGSQSRDEDCEADAE